MEKNPFKRPTSVTILCVWMWLVAGVLLFVFIMDYEIYQAQVSVGQLAPVDLWLPTVTNVASIVISIAMFRGHNWARFAYIFGSGGMVILQTLNSGASPAALIAALGIWATFLYFLTTPKAVLFFGWRKSRKLEQSAAA